MNGYAVRPGTNADVPFIMRRTLKDLRNSDFARAVPNDLFYTYEHRAWEHHLTQSLVRVAHPAPVAVAHGVKHGTADSKRILGYLVCDPSEVGLIVHYCYVRRSVDEYGHETENFRRRGIAKELILSVQRDYPDILKEDFPIVYTKRTAQFRYDAEFREFVDHGERFQHNPYLFYTLLPEHWEMGIKRPPSYEAAYV